MLTGYTSPTTTYRLTQNTDPQPSGGISRLLAAAVINQGFRNLLLTHPDQALTEGYQGEKFPLDFNEKNLVISIRADSLSDFATQIISDLEDSKQGCSGQWIPVNQRALVLDAE
ncbi:MAG: hypothetical protein ACC633_09015 [Anaerolineales bacterium]